jgi:hypothetical protein
MMRWVSALAGAAVAMVQPVLENAGADDVWIPRVTPEAEPTARIFTTQCVSESFAAAVRAGVLRAVLVVDQPASSYHDVRAAGHGPVPALRHLVSCATAQGELVACPGALTLTRDGRRDAAQTLGALLDHLGVPLDAGALADLSARFGIAGGGTGLDAALLGSEPPEAVHPVLTAEDEALVRAVLVPAFGYGGIGVRLKVVWPRGCLFWGDRPNDEPAPRIIEMTGRARNLVYGPYFRLPPGRWRMGTTLAFSPSARRARLALCLFGPDHLGGGQFTVERAGVFAASAMVVVPPAREGLEIRLSLEHGAIEGELGLDGISFTPEPG